MRFLYNTATFISTLKISVSDEENKTHNNNEKQMLKIKSLHQKKNDLVNITVKTKMQTSQHIFKNSIVTAIIDENRREYKIEPEHFNDSVSFEH